MAEGDPGAASRLQVPKEWSNLKRARVGGIKGRDSVKKRFKSDTIVSNNSADSIEDICRCICDNIGRCEDLEYELDFSDVLSHIDYRGVLEGLFSGRGMGAEVPIVTREYEESFMREPMAGERKCIMGASCEAMFIDKTKPFIAVEFQLPNGKAVDTPQMCVLCSRKHTQRLFYDFLYRATPASCTGVIQRYGVLFDTPGEYRKDACLIMPPHGPVHCMPYPSVAYQRSHFTVQTHCMSHYLQQSNGLHFFQTPPATSSDPSSASQSALGLC
jgi:hypothetical protein